MHRWTRQEIADICKRRAVGQTLQQVGAADGVSHQAISQVLARLGEYPNSRANRREIVRRMTAKGKSTRAIAEVLGVGRVAVHRLCRRMEEL